MSRNDSEVHTPATIGVICGVHGAGKSTVGGHLDSTKLNFCPQTADWLLNRGYEPDPIGAFQRAIFDHERARDRYLAERDTLPIIESWHLGNLAYSEEMPVGTELRKQQREYITTAIESAEVKVVFLDLDPVSIWSRSAIYSPGNKSVRNFEQRAGTSLESFYSGFRDCLLRLFDEFDVTYHRVDASMEIDEVVAAATKTFEEL